MNPLDILCEGLVVVLVDEETSMVCLWNGSVTFNIYTVDLTDGKWHHMDVFTSSYEPHPLEAARMAHEWHDTFREEPA